MIFCPRSLLAKMSGEILYLVRIRLKLRQWVGAEAFGRAAASSSMDGWLSGGDVSEAASGNRNERASMATYVLTLWY